LYLTSYLWHNVLNWLSANLCYHSEM